jgi:hypothetical protein
MSEKLAEGSQETVEYRGRTITVWRTFDFVGRRPIRRWYFDTGQHRALEGYKTREEAIWTAKVYISGQMWRLHLRNMFGDQFDFNNDLNGLDGLDDLGLDEALDLTDTAPPPQTDDRRDRIREWLETVTVENGFTAAEEATAKEKLSRM